MKLRKTIQGIFAGVCIGLGGIANLSCDNRYVGAFLFSLALLVICKEGYFLFTGRVCYVPFSAKKFSYSSLSFGLLGNLIGSVGVGVIFSIFAGSEILEKLSTICANKLAQTPIQTLMLAIACGLMVFFAVDIYNRKKVSVEGILICIPAFVLCGFEHSIADMFYLAVGRILSFEAFWYIILVLIGNVIGGCLFPALSLIEREK